MREITRDEWIDQVPLTDRKAEALYRRHVQGQDQQEASEAMDCASNVDNLERAARSDIIQAKNLVSLARTIGIEIGEPSIGTCAEE